MYSFGLPYLLSAGTQHAEDHQEQRGIFLSNAGSFLLCGILLFLLLGRTMILQEYDKVFINSLFSYLMGFLIFISPYFLNKWGWIYFSRLFLCSAPVLYVWFQFVSGAHVTHELPVSQIDTIRLYIVALSGLPYLVLNIRKPWIFAIGILPSAVSLLFFEAIASGLMGIYYDQMQRHADYALMPMRTRVAFLIVSSLCMTFHWTIVQNDKKLNALIDQLKEKNKRINEQNEELLAREELLHHLNANLEEMVKEKTLKIQQQNEQILKYAFANAHEFRGPVARLLALVSVSKMDKSIDQSWLLDHIDLTTKELDEIVRRISKELSNVN